MKDVLTYISHHFNKNLNAFNDYPYVTVEIWN